MILKMKPIAGSITKIMINISVNDVIELKGFDSHNAESSTPKPKEIPLTVPKLDELQLLQEIQRSTDSSKSQPASGGSRFISFFKSKQENQQQESPLSFNSEKREDSPKSSNLNDLFGANQVWPEMPVSAGVLASDIEKRMHAIDTKGDSPTLLPELIDTIRNPPEVHIKGLKPMSSRSTEQPKWEDDIIASLLPKNDVFMGKEKQQPKLLEESKPFQHQNIYQQNDRQNIRQQNNRE
uniref:Uncharacterized protein n=1 Tax=Panagrolaimus sp. PS1159 TaxID=55785 RepID=A0AC35GAM2_9BILA